jgi:hypothetical protein
MERNTVAAGKKKNDEEVDPFHIGILLQIDREIKSDYRRDVQINTVDCKQFSMMMQFTLEVKASGLEASQSRSDFPSG